MMTIAYEFKLANRKHALMQAETVLQIDVPDLSDADNSPRAWARGSLGMLLNIRPLFSILIAYDFKQQSAQVFRVGLLKRVACTSVVRDFKTRIFTKAFVLLNSGGACTTSGLELGIMCACM